MCLKFSTISIIGKPNAGKSTLINKIIQQKISIVSPKVQTTRIVINGIFTEKNSQLVFVDTPGIFTPNNDLNKIMIDSTWKKVKQSNFVLILLDATDTFDSNLKNIIDSVLEFKKNVLFVLNKIDLVSDLSLLKNSISKYDDIPIFEISALNEIGISYLIDYLVLNSPPGEWKYPKDQITTVSMKLLSEEITREQLFLQLGKEIPYSVYIFTTDWKERQDGSVLINQTIFVGKESHKVIIIGNSGNKIKRIGEQARLNIEDALNMKVHLFLSIKVNDKWKQKLEKFMVNYK